LRLALAEIAFFAALYPTLPPSCIPPGCFVSGGPAFLRFSPFYSAVSAVVRGPQIPPNTGLCYDFSCCWRCSLLFFGLYFPYPSCALFFCAVYPPPFVDPLGTPPAGLPCETRLPISELGPCSRMVRSFFFFFRPFFPPPLRHGPYRLIRGRTLHFAPFLFSLSLVAAPLIVAFVPCLHGFF